MLARLAQLVQDARYGMRVLKREPGFAVLAIALIMTGQVAVACVLLAGAAAVTRSFVALIHADRGYDPVNVLTAWMTFFHWRFR
jgi:hypothetical protein